jgi:phosphoglycolate phosphatase
VKPTHLFFDLDGTLTDPQQGICACIVHALQAMDHPLPAHAELRSCIGHPLEDIFRDLLPTGQPDRIARAIALYRERFGTVGLFENEVYDGIPETLAGLADSGRWSLSVVTAKPTGFARQILAHFQLGRFFRGVYGSELDGSRVHKRDIIAFALQRENLAPSQAVMIGDRDLDILGARHHGLQALAVTWGYGNIEELRAAKPDLWADTPSQIPVVLHT